MPIIDLLATSLERRDEIPNIELATQIAETNDKSAISEVVMLLEHKNKQIVSDAIKVIYETGMRNPGLIAPHTEPLIRLLDHKNNRLQWGAMTALNAITSESPEKIWAALPKILATADAGTVITNDHCVGILIKMCAVQKHADDAFSLLNERLLKSPYNQLPMYAENALPIITKKNKSVFLNTLASRVNSIEKETKKKRVEKVMKKALSI